MQKWKKLEKSPSPTVRTIHCLCGFLWPLFGGCGAVWRVCFMYRSGLVSLL